MGTPWRSVTLVTRTRMGDDGGGIGRGFWRGSRPMEGMMRRGKTDASQQPGREVLRRSPSDPGPRCLKHGKGRSHGRRGRGRY